ncbi:MAG TPA: hypothetical protein VFS21_37675 [Roseiflexaceae bacterium]|nr:hypothetical protein [Roseiflexaceae bacterium]
MTIPDYPVAQLPAALKERVWAALEQRQYGRAAADLAAYLASGERDPAALICLARCRVEEARWGPFEEILLRAQEGLELLREASGRGAPAPLLRKPRARIGAVQRAEQQLQALETAPPAALTDGQVEWMRGRAFALDSRKKEAPDLLTAARLWRTLHGYAQAIPSANRPENGYYYQARAGLAFAEGGRLDLALPICETVLAWQLPGNPHRYWVPEAIHRTLLVQAIGRGDRAAFVEHWRASLAVADKQGSFFPATPAMQDRLLAQALEWRMPEICRHVLDVIIERRPARKRTPETHDLIRRALLFLSDAPPGRD